MGCEHFHLAQVRDFDHHSIIIHWQRLLPRLSINPHVCVVGPTFLELEPDPVSLSQMSPVPSRGKQYEPMPSVSEPDNLEKAIIYIRWSQALLQIIVLFS